MATSPVDKSAPPLSAILQSETSQTVMGGATEEGIKMLTKIGNLLGDERAKDTSDHEWERTDDDSDEGEVEYPAGTDDVKATPFKLDPSPRSDSFGKYALRPTVMFPSQEAFDIWCRENSVPEESSNKLLFERYGSLGETIVVPLDSVQLLTLSLRTAEAAREEREHVAEGVRVLNGQMSSLAREVGTIASLTEAIQALAGAADRDIRWLEERFNIIKVFMQFMMVEEDPVPRRWEPLLWELDYGKLAAALDEFDDIEDKERILAKYMAQAKASLAEKKSA